MLKLIRLSAALAAAAVIVSFPQIVRSRPESGTSGSSAVRNTRSGSLFCYMQTPQGTTLNLENLCRADDGSSNTAANVANNPATINPNGAAPNGTPAEAPVTTVVNDSTRLNTPVGTNTNANGNPNGTNPNANTNPNGLNTNANNGNLNGTNINANTNPNGINPNANGNPNGINTNVNNGNLNGTNINANTNPNGTNPNGNGNPNGINTNANNSNFNATNPNANSNPNGINTSPNNLQ